MVGNKVVGEMPPFLSVQWGQERFYLDMGQVSKAPPSTSYFPVAPSLKEAMRKFLYTSHFNHCKFLSLGPRTPRALSTGARLSLGRDWPGLGPFCCRMGLATSKAPSQPHSLAPPACSGFVLTEAWPCVMVPRNGLNMVCPPKTHAGVESPAWGMGGWRVHLALC